MAVCDWCNSDIPDGEGYLVYSKAKALPLLGEDLVRGCLLLCERCANDVYSEENFAKDLREFRTSLEVNTNDLGSFFKQYTETTRKADTVSIINIAKQLGFSREQALDKARELAREWWKDRESAQAKAKALAESAPARKRRLWPFWRK